MNIIYYATSTHTTYLEYTFYIQKISARNYNGAFIYRVVKICKEFQVFTRVYLLL